MLQEQEPEFTQTFAYEKKGNSAVIRRCFSRDTKAVIPEEIDGLPVTEIGAYAFSAHLDEDAFQKDLADGKIKISRSVFAEENLPVLDAKLEEIVFPISVVRVGRYCFYNCDHLKTLSFGDGLKDWGSGVFTGCHHIRSIRMAVSGDGSSMLKDMLDEIREELCVDYIELKNQDVQGKPEEIAADEARNTENRNTEDRNTESRNTESRNTEGRNAEYSSQPGGYDFEKTSDSYEQQRTDRTADPERPYRAPVTARLMFPEFYEEGVENTPARILETHVHGSGILYRNCFQGRKIDFYQYDNAFPHAEAQESDEFVLQLALWRLRYPKGLNKRARERYLDFLENHVSEYAELLVKKRQIEEIRWICRTLEEEKRGAETSGGMVLSGFLDALTEWAGRKQYAEALSFVMDYRHAHHALVKKRTRLEL